MLNRIILWLIIDPQICHIKDHNNVHVLFDIVTTSHHLYKVYVQSSCVLKVKTPTFAPAFASYGYGQ